MRIEKNEPKKTKGCFKRRKDDELAFEMSQHVQRRTKNLVWKTRGLHVPGIREKQKEQQSSSKDTKSF